MKFIKGIFIIVILLFVVLLTLPVVFKGQLMELARQEVNKAVKAQVDWDDFNVSVFKGFPDLKVSMEGLSVLGMQPFEKDTLVSFQDFSVKVDLFSAFSGKIKVKSIILNKPVVRAISLNDTLVNWDITYSSEKTTDSQDDTVSSGKFEIKLKEFRIQNAGISYYDALSSTFASISGFDFLLSGNFSAAYSDLNLDASVEELSLDVGGMSYLKNAFLSLKTVLDADLENMKFELKENELKINEISLKLAGGFEIMPNEDILVNLGFETGDTDFKSLLSMIPAVYLYDYQDIKTSGVLSVRGTAKGEITDSSLPELDVNLTVRKGFMAYPDLPEAINNIEMDLNVFYDGFAEDNSRVDLDQFHLDIAGNPVDMNFRIRTPVSDMQMNGKLMTYVDLGSLKNALPLENLDVQGRMNADLEMMGRISDIENENYEDFNAEGELEVFDLIATGELLPVPVKVQNLNMKFTPRFVYLENFIAELGESDLRMEGKIENFIPFAMKGETLKGMLNLDSDMLNMNELLASQPEKDVSDIEDTSSLTVVEIPSSIDFRLQTRVSDMIYDKLLIEDLYGLVKLKQGILNMDALTMNLLKGTMELSGEYNTQDISTPMLEMEMKLNNIDIESSFRSFNTVEKLIPAAEMMRGAVSVKMGFVTFLDSSMSPVLNTFVGSGHLETGEVGFENNETLFKVARLIGKEDMATQKFKDVDLDFEIREGRVTIEPFDAGIGEGNVNISGNQSLDQTMDYDLLFEMPLSEFGETANDIISGISAKAGEKGLEWSPEDKVKIGVSITGTFSDPKISVEAAEGLKSKGESAQEIVKEKLREKGGEVKQEVMDSANEEAERILQKAEEEAENLRQKAEQTGKALIGEAKLRKKQLVKEAGDNPFKKIAAEKTGDGLITSAENQAEKIKDEADKQADAVLENARKKVEEMKQKEK